VGTVFGSLIVVNYYAGSVSQPTLVLEQQDYQHSHLQQHPRQHQRQQQEQEQQLRIERSSTSTSTSNTVEAGDNLARSFNIVSPNTKSPKTSLQLTQQQPKKERRKQIFSSNSSFQVEHEPSFFELARQTGTDKVKGVAYLPSCLEDDSTCTRPSCEREKCRPWGHFYHTMYQQKLSKFLNSDEDFLLLEIGYNLGFGYDTYRNFFAGVPGAEFHTIEISCIEEGPREEGKWPWGNFAKENKEYQSLLDKKRLHCGDASDVEWLHRIWNEHMYRQKPNNSLESSPPLKIVVDDGSHLAKHMIYSIFFWFPRIEPGGILIIEDTQPIDEANLLRTQFLPQIMADLHFCGDPNQHKDEPCFPQLYPLLQSIHCEMHICVLERNERPAIPYLSIEESKPPPNALNMTQCYTFANVFGLGMDAQ